MNNKNPVNDYLAEKTAAREARKQKEIDLWHNWQTNGQQPRHLQPLLKLYEPNISQKVRTWKAPSVPEAAFKAELQTHLIKAFESYDPSRGAALNTHVENRLQKAKRYNARHQNFAYIPEGQISHIGEIRQIHDQLSEEYGRTPSPAEISERLEGRLSPKRVAVIQKSFRKDLPSSDFEKDPAERATSYEDQQLAVAQHLLPQIFPGKPEMHTLFHYTFGTNGHPQVLSTGELAKKMGKSQSQISRMKTQLGVELRRQMGLDRKEE